MQAERQLLQQTIENMPDRLVREVLDFVDYLETRYEDYGAPESVIVKNEDDSRRKLEEGLEDIEAGRTYAWEDVLKELNVITAE